jgi:hypothetical protein
MNGHDAEARLARPLVDSLKGAVRGDRCIGSDNSDVRMSLPPGRRGPKTPRSFGCM